ncbi:GGDEF domain-containing protein [Elusimicrobiota bacterium]
MSNKNLKSILTALLIFIFAGITLALDKTSGYFIISMASALLIMELGKSSDNFLSLIIFTALLTALLLLSDFPSKLSSIVILLSVIPIIRIKNIERQGLLGFNSKDAALEEIQRKLNRKHEKLKKTIVKNETEIDRYSKLYELSKEIEKTTSKEELAEKSLESLNFKINADKLAFYTASKREFQVLKTKNVDKETAERWLGNIDYTRNSPDDNFYKFDLKAGRKNLGMILCNGNLSYRRINEAEVLISQIVLGYEKATLYEKVIELSRIDGLTGLFLRKYFFGRLSEEMKRAEREHYKIAIIMCDLDNFKKYNDTHGHPVGDKLLKKTASIIRNNIYSSDFACRYGGEEFLIYVPMAEPAGVTKMAEKIRRLIKKNTTETISMGISYFPDHADDPENLVKAADSALYEAKEQGKNKISYYNK